jgi:phosphate transport system substrate-binding protein
VKPTRTSRLAAGLAAGALLLAACSDADQAGGGTDSAGGAPSSLSGTLSGAGASSQSAAVLQGWKIGFEEQNPGVTINYDPVGSGGGREQFLSGGVPFAGSDRALEAEELEQSKTVCGGATAYNLPLYISPIAVAYNLPGVEELNLSPATLAGIFTGRITSWDAPEIAADNEGTELPSTQITPVHRADDSGTTENFTDYLAATAPEIWTFEPDGEWPVEGGEAAQGTSGVVQAATGAEGAITYADASQVGNLGVARVQVGEEFVELTAEAAAAVVENSPRDPDAPAGDLTIDLQRDTTGSGEYPIVLVSYSLVCPTYADAATAELVKGFFSYVVSEEGQEAAAEAAGSAPISDALREEIQPLVEGIEGA